ncbi:MAG: hypothetical protein ABIY50_12365 [Ignavibacteria bacterium]
MDKRKNLFKDNDGYFVKGFELYIHKTTNIEAPLTIDLPNIAAMFLNISDKAKESAGEIYINKLEPFISISENGKYFEFKTEKAEEHLFDFFEQLFVSIIFMYSAVESIVNNLIPNDYTEIRLIKKIQETKGKKYIEKNDTLENKIKIIINKIYCSNSKIHNTESWKNFKELQRIRNEIVHFKSEELEGNKHSIGPLLSELFYKIVKLRIIESGREIINFLMTVTNNYAAIPFEFHKLSINSDLFEKHFVKKT